MDYRLSKIINIVRSLNEEMMTANAPGTSGGFGSNPSKSGVDGFDPVMKGPVKRKKKYASGGYGSRKRWLDHLKTPTNGRRD